MIWRPLEIMIVQENMERISSAPMQILPSMVACLKAKSRALARMGVTVVMGFYLGGKMTVTRPEVRTSWGSGFFFLFGSSSSSVFLTAATVVEASSVVLVAAGGGAVEAVLTVVPAVFAPETVDWLAAMVVPLIEPASALTVLPTRVVPTRVPALTPMLPWASAVTLTLPTVSMLMFSRAMIRPLMSPPALRRYCRR